MLFQTSGHKTVFPVESRPTLQNGWQQMMHVLLFILLKWPLLLFFHKHIPALVLHIVFLSLGSSREKWYILCFNVEMQEKNNVVYCTYTNMDVITHNLWAETKAFNLITAQWRDVVQYHHVQTVQTGNYCLLKIYYGGKCKGFYNFCKT